MKARINPFQETMLYWNDLMPYNAVHVARIQGRPNLQRLRFAVEAVLQSRHLTHMTIDLEQKCFHFSDASLKTDLSVVPSRNDARRALAKQTEVELNTPFDCRQAFNPFRIFFIENAGAFYLGLVYFHALADGEAIIRLMREIIDLYIDERRSGRKFDHNFCSTSLWRLLPRNPLCVFRWLHAIPRHLREIRESSRPPLHSEKLCRTVFKLRDLEPAGFSEVMRYAQRLNVTVNDVFLGVLMKALSPYAEGRFTAERRRNLAIAFIMNIRRDLSGLGEDTFGMFLSSYHIAHPLPAAMKLDELIREIHMKTKEIKKKKLYVLNLLGQSLVAYWMRKNDREHCAKFYRRNYPLWGGLTNVDLAWYWKDMPYDDFYYLRAASAGPAAPLTLAVTTSTKRVSVAVSSNPQVYETEEVDNILSNFVSSLSLPLERKL